jgi:hypothetical protein
MTFGKLLYIGIVLAALGTQAQTLEGTAIYDIVIYGGTSAGVVAAIEAKRMGKSVVVIEPGNRIGGLTTGGLGWTDVGNKAAIGGVSLEFYEAVKKYYADPAVWKWQHMTEYQTKGQNVTVSGPNTEAMWIFEPSAALSIFQNWIAEKKVEIVYGERLARTAGVMTDGAEPPRIEAIKMESGKVFHGRMFIDAGYEGDLMATAHISYTVGREANSTYGETYDGVQAARATNHNLHLGINPYIVEGRPESGLLPFINPATPAADGSGDEKIQAYCFRMCLTNRAENRIPFAKPAGYDERCYELLFRNFKAGETNIPWINSPLPNGKTDTNNGGGFSTDFIGQNYAYPDASYADRAAIAARHLLYQKGLMWTLANHPRVPEAIRKTVSHWGVCRDEFQDSEGWPQQLYVREARRMIGELVITQRYCQGAEKAEEPIGLAAYTMDSHNTQRYVDDGQVRNEGNIEIRGFPPYAIDLHAITPKATECGNLLVPICLSATHIAYGSIRMEPVFMVLAQSAATIAAEALDEKVTVQKVDYSKLKEKLLADKQVLAWVKPAGK